MIQKLAWVPTEGTKAARILELRQQGLTVRQIAIEVPCHQNWVRKVLAMGERELTTHYLYDINLKLEECVILLRSLSGLKRRDFQRRLDKVRSENRLKEYLDRVAGPRATPKTILPEQ